MLRGVGVGFEWIILCNGMEEQLARVTSPKSTQGYRMGRVKEGQDDVSFIQYCAYYMDVQNAH